MAHRSQRIPFNWLTSLAIVLLSCNLNPSEQPQFIKNPSVSFSQPHIKISRQEVVLSAGDVINFGQNYRTSDLVSDTLMIISHVEWSLVNGSPSAFRVMELTPRSDSTMILISALQNNSMNIDRVAKLVVYAKGVAPQEVTIRQEAAIPITEITGGAGSLVGQDGDFSNATFSFIKGLSFDPFRKYRRIARLSERSIFPR